MSTASFRPRPVAKMNACIRMRYGAMPSPASHPRLQVVSATSGSIYVSSAELLHSLRAEPAFEQQLQDPGFAIVAATHMLLHESITRAVPLCTAQTKVPDAQGVFMRGANTAAAPPAAAPAAAGSSILRVQTLQPPSSFTGAAALDWAHHTFALSPFYCYSKSSCFTPDSSMTPHFELEMGVSPGQFQVLLYTSMDPKLSLMLAPSYLDHFYLTPPPGGSSTSWADLEAHAASCPGFNRFTSPDMHVCAFSRTAILFKVDKEGWSAAKEVLADAASIWAAWATSTTAFVDAPPLAAAAAGATGGEEAGTAAAAGTGQQGTHTLPGELAARSWAWRRFPRRERAAPMLKGVFGEQAMEDYWDSMAGEQRIRV